MRLLGWQCAEVGDEVAQGEAIAGEADLEEVEQGGEVVALAVELGVGKRGASVANPLRGHTGRDGSSLLRPIRSFGVGHHQPLALSRADVLLAAQALRRYYNSHESVSTQNQAGSQLG